MFPRDGKTAAAILAAILLAICLTGCGSGGGQSTATTAALPSGSGASEGVSESEAVAGAGEVVAAVGSKPITRAAVSHWMAVSLGSDYYELSHSSTAPLGLVSDPPRYNSCVGNLEAAIDARQSKVRVSGLDLLTKCRELYLGLKAQAVEKLIEVDWLTGIAGDLGVTVSDQEVQAFYEKATAAQFPRSAEVSARLAARRMSVSDELVVQKGDLLAQRVLQKIKSQGQLRSASLRAAEAHWNEQTSCHAGYVVEHCAQYRGQPAQLRNAPPTSVLIERVVALVTGRCTNLAACGKQ